MRKLFLLGSDTAGAVAIEIGLVAPILASMLLGMSELSLGFSAKLKLEQVAQTAIEKVMQGQAKANTDSAALLKAEAASLAGVPLANVTVSFFLECVNATSGVAVVTTPYTSVCTTTEESRRYMKVIITKAHVPLFGLGFPGTNAAGNYDLTGKTSVRVQ